MRDVSGWAWPLFRVLVVVIVIVTVRPALVWIDAIVELAAPDRSPD
jgi:hypothetical protein